jgi:cell division protein FtsN
MAKDYAKKKQVKAGSRKKRSKSQPSSGKGRYGLLLVVLLGLLGYRYFALDFKQLQQDVLQTITLAQEKATQVKAPKFEFYTRLPQGHRALEQNTTKAHTSSETTTAQATPSPEANPIATQNTTVAEKPAPVEDGQQYVAGHKQYIIQVGSFKNFDDADRLRASLILQGYQSRISRFVNHATTWYRVEVGPYTNLKQAKTNQITLEKIHFNGLIKQVS